MENALFSVFFWEQESMRFALRAFFLPLTDTNSFFIEPLILFKKREEWRVQRKERGGARRSKKNEKSATIKIQNLVFSLLTTPCFQTCKRGTTPSA